MCDEWIDNEFAAGQFATNPEGGGLVCKAGKQLKKIGEKQHHGLPHAIYRAKAADCAECEWKAGCCGKKGGPRQVERVLESEAMRQYLERMKQPATQQLYKKRAEVAEFPNLWIKSILGIRPFRVRGPTKALMEMTWAAISYTLPSGLVRWQVKVAGMAAA